MRPLKLILASVLVLLLGPAVAGANWSHPGYSAANLRSSPVDSALSAANIGQTEQRWVWSLPVVNEEAESAQGPPLVTAGMAFVRVNGERIQALDAATGAHAWQADLGFTGVQEIAALGNTLYAVSDDRLLSFPARCRTDGGTCEPRVMATGAARLGAPVITATRVLVVERNLDAGYRLLAFDRSCVQACAPLWRYRYAGALSDPSAANGLAWVGTAGGSVLGLPLECVPNAAGACAYTRRAAAAGKPMNFLPPAVTSRRIYTVAQSYLYSFPTDCAEVCGPAWRSQDPVYGWPSVAGSLVWVTQDPGANKMRVDGFSTVCRPVAGKCRPIASIDASDGQPAGPRGLQRRISVADGMLFVPITAQQNHPAGVKVYPTTCRFESCPSIRRFGNDVPTGPPTIANGVVYMAEQLPVLDGSDPGPWFSSVRAFALAQD